ncbi:helix-turn-helix domain-containing protein [Cohnella cholangitidis]|uniref:Helix-turn-helix transcriptional regulator n=1 Tax=Cohnella cholangitidis TaxID=2598458 RepID=A0A7G5C5F4_9BACL|nr:helix-turn-helix transcriptional regulator [Cohnella cholangitidis]QMV44438.1 helix-turn-helix transcriptional regulator [Cohnella cholangitidis]
MEAVKRRHTPYNKFKAFLAENDIKQHELAATLDKSASAVNQNLNGTGGDFSVEEIRKLCVKYGISSDEYFIYSQVSNVKPDEALFKQGVT